MRNRFKTPGPGEYVVPSDFGYVTVSPRSDRDGSKERREKTVMSPYRQQMKPVGSKDKTIQLLKSHVKIAAGSNESLAHTPATWKNLNSQSTKYSIGFQDSKSALQTAGASLNPKFLSPKNSFYRTANAHSKELLANNSFPFKMGANNAIVSQITDSEQVRSIEIYDDSRD